MNWVGKGKYISQNNHMIKLISGLRRAFIRYARFEPLIEDYNKLKTQPELTDRIAAYLEQMSSKSDDSKTVEKFRIALLDELSPIFAQSAK